MNDLMHHRLESIDRMRGLVIVLMALDHTRHFFTNAQFSPTDLDHTSAAYFLTRWMTHLCAPTFVFLAGTGAFLSVRRRNLTSRQLARYLFSRGIWLILLELTLVRFGWSFNWNYHAAIGQVIWALGCSLLALSGLVFLPRRFLAAISLAIIAGHNAFDHIPADSSEPWGWLWMVMHVPGRIEYLPGYAFYVSYPLIPWIAVMAAGYCLAPIFLQPPKRRQSALLLLGLASIGAFLLLRLGNFYGDPKPWQPQYSPAFTVFSVLNCTKYPPSLLYLLMTLGMMFIGLALFDRFSTPRRADPLLNFGKAPLFFYMIHLPLIHGAALVSTLVKGLPVDWLIDGSGRSTIPSVPSPEYGFDLPVIYAIWLALLLLLYPLCLAFVQIKRKHRHLPWLQYL
ncbi:MAG: DUF1624 domain-containing protein [Gammaproteobacteria bacterium]